MNPFSVCLQKPSVPTLVPDRTALLVVDMQYFDAHPKWGEGRTAIEMGVAHCFDAYFAQIDAAIPRIQQLLALFRNKEMEVIHVRVAEWTRDSRDVGKKQLVRGLVVPCDSQEAALLEAVAPVDDEIVISKSSSGVFPVTNIDRLLRNMGIQTLIFTGTATGGCIESAVRDAMDLGYEVIIASDACADSTPESQQQALDRMCGGHTHLRTTAELVRELTSLPDSDRRRRSGLERVKPYLPQPPATPPGPEVNPYSLIFPPAVELPIAAQNSALVLIDTQRFMCDPTCGLGRLVAETAHSSSVQSEIEAYYARVRRALARMQRLLAVCRRAGVQIIHVRTAGQLPDGRDLSRNLRDQGIQIVQGDAEAAFMPAVEPQPGEIILNKPGAGIFTGTGLDELLRNLRIEHLYLTGISAIGALEGSVRSATDRGYGVILVPDACAAARAPEESRLRGMESGIIQVKMGDDLIKIIETWVDGTDDPGGQ